MKSRVKIPPALSAGTKTFLLLLFTTVFGSVAHPAAIDKDAEVISALVTAEETYLALSPKMSALSKGLLNLRLPGAGADTVFAPSVSVSEVGPAPAMTATDARLIESRTWPVAKDTKEVTMVDLWRSLLDAVSWFDYAKVHVISGEHPNGDLFRFVASNVLTFDTPDASFATDVSNQAGLPQSQ